MSPVLSPPIDVVLLSRLQFGLTAMYHFLFVPLTLGLAILLVVMESVYVMTGRTIWRQMTQFWGTLFGINFALGVATGITMEFQFGMNWAYYSHYVGDIFGAPLAIESLMAFFLEASFIGLFFFGWDRLSKVGHLTVTCLVALGSNLSALWILIANAWMQHPVGARFNPDTMRMEVTDFRSVLFNPVAQDKFVHTASAGYVTGSIFVAAISAYYLLRGRHIEMAKRSMAVAASFGLAAALSVVVLGDESGYTAGTNQKMKIAAIEAMWTTEKAPAPFTLFGIPNQATHETAFALRLPFALGLIVTRSLSKPVPGIIPLVEEAKGRIAAGLAAYRGLQALKHDRTDTAARLAISANGDDLGYALLLKAQRPDIENATPEEIDKAAWTTVPAVLPLFFSFRIMVGLGFFFIALFATTFYFVSLRKIQNLRPLLWTLLLSLPLPWIAAELGWFVSEVGRQPWVIEGVLPTFLAVSSLSAGNVIFTLVGFVIFYSTLLAVDIYLMVKTVRQGPVPATAPLPPAAAPAVALSAAAE